MTEWKTDSNGRRYQYVTLDGGRAGATVMESGEVWAHRYHPYDLAEYYAAYSADGAQWVIYRDSLARRGRSVRDRMQGTTDEVVARLAELDREVVSRMDRS